MDCVVVGKVVNLCLLHMCVDKVFLVVVLHRGIVAVVDRGWLQSSINDGL